MTIPQEGGLNSTQLRTRHGKILERLTEKALGLAGFTFRFDWQYDDYCISPDFILLANDRPFALLEVTQTDSRDSMRMKSLRYFELIAQAKLHFGEKLQCASLIFGTPKDDIQETFVVSSLSVFDCALLPLSDNGLSNEEKTLIGQLESRALELAHLTVSANEAAEQMVDHGGVQVLADYLKASLNNMEPNKILGQVWDAESKRAQLSAPRSDLPEIDTTIKKGVLQCAMLSDYEFERKLPRQADHS
jgi:hypothetical protein